MIAAPGALGREFFERECEVVARELLGAVLVHGRRAGRIVETEAYLGADDLASHARFGETARNRVMFGAGGASYVYLIYGMHEMFNVVADRAGRPSAVLVRAIEPVAGLGDDAAVGRGPGKLTRALGITRTHSGVDLTTSRRLYIAAGARAREVEVGPRVGIDYAGAWAKAALRFWIPGSPAVSRGR